MGLISSDVIRGYNDTIILHILLQGDSYGYEISREIEKRSGGSYVMKETTLYSAIARLEKRGMLCAYQGQQSHGRPRTYYAITEPGRQYYGEKCAEWAVTRQVIDQFTGPMSAPPDACADNLLLLKRPSLQEKEG